MRDRTSAGGATWLPPEGPEALAAWGTDNLQRVVAIDSQSDESSRTIPSTEGQKRLAGVLQDFFGNLGFEAEQDDYANLLVTIPGNVDGAPPLALMVHMDTSEGTQPIEELLVEKLSEGLDLRSRAEVYWEMAEECLREAREELRRGNLKQASEKI